MNYVEKIKKLNKPFVITSELAEIFGVTPGCMYSRLDRAAEQGLPRYKLPSGSNFTWIYPADELTKFITDSPQFLFPQRPEILKPDGVMERVERKLDLLLREIGINPKEV